MLTLYRRHTKNCKVHALRLPARAKRHYQDCDCPIWVYGHTDTEDFPRRSTKLTDWAAAEAYRRSEVERSKKATEPLAAAPSGPTIKHCGDQFLKMKAHELGQKTVGQYELLFGRLVAYFEKRGVSFMQELTVGLIEEFKVEGLPKLANTTKGITVAKLRCFLREAYRLEWIKKPLAEQVRPHRAVYEQKVPYTDAEVGLILAGAAKLNGGREGYAGAPATFRLLLELMLETGMRVSDAVRFDPAKVRKGDSLWIYTFTQEKRRQTKKLESIEAYLSDRLKTAIENCKWLSPTRPFWFGSQGNRYGVAYQVYDRMQTIGERVGVADCRPHRLRDTFAARALTRGVSIGDVSRLLGHSSVKITETYYAAWIPARGRRLESVVAQTLVNS
jgi:integrase/recombinase XerD